MARALVAMNEDKAEISKLPDEVLSHILSFLPTMEAVATSLLSKKWRHVWKRVPALEWFPSKDIAKEEDSNMKMKVNEFLRLRGVKTITRLHLKCLIHSRSFLYLRHGSSCSNYVEEWVDEALTGKVEHVNLCLKACRSCHWNDEVSLPIRLLTCATVVTMKIEGEFTLRVPSSVHLPSLKSLHINVRRCEPSCEKFLSGSPALEVFYLKEGQDLEIKRQYSRGGDSIVSNNPLKARVYVKLHKVSSRAFTILEGMRNDVEFLSLYSDLYQSWEVNSCLAFKQFPNLVHLELHIESNAVSFPENLFACTKIETLKLQGPFVLSVPSRVQLPPSLKSLHLDVRICEPSCEKFLSGSPALEFFYLKEGQDLEIKRHSQGDSIVSNNPLYLLAIDSYDGYRYIQDYLEGHLENVVKARVYVKLHQVSSLALPILNELRNVEFLSLSYDMNQSMEANYSLDFMQFRNLVHLELHIESTAAVSFPVNLFACTKMVTLKLEGPFVLSVPSSVQLPPSLKSLHLRVRKCEPSYKEFLYASPVLEVFCLEQEWCDGIEKLRIERNSRGNRIISNNPLLNLDIRCHRGYYYVQDYVEGHLENIVKAEVYMTLNAAEDKKNLCHSPKVYYHASSILKAICNVEFLSLHDKNFSSETSPVDLPKFPNLVKLKLFTTTFYSSLFFKLLSREYCPKLEVYSLNNFYWTYSEHQKQWIKRSGIPDASSSLAHLHLS